MSALAPSSESIYEDAQPLNCSGERVEELAGQFAAKFDFKAGGDLKPLVKRLRGEIKFLEPDDPQIDGEIVVNRDKSFTIHLTQYSGLLRTRFTIAHELGHYAPHSLMGQKPIRISRKRASTPEGRKLEAEANRFAAALLMPKTEFEASFKEFVELAPPLERAEINLRLASKFYVSILAVEARRGTLKL